MRIVVQRVTRASVSIGGEMVSSIGKGLMVLIGVEVGDTEQDAVNAAKNGTIDPEKVADEIDRILGRRK